MSSYEIITTKAWVIARYPLREEDCGYLVYTQSAGLIHVWARSTKSIRSRLRFHLTAYSVCTMAMIYGKRGWQCINVFSTYEWSWYESAEEKKLALAKFAKFCESMIGVDVHDEHVSSIIFLFLHELRKISSENLKVFELYFYVRLMTVLGYFPKQKETDISIQRDFDESVLGYYKKNIKTITKLLDQSVYNSHLASSA